MNTPLQGAGLGFRREIINELKQIPIGAVDFFELAPENWMGIGGHYAKDLNYFTQRYPFTCHGLSLSIGSTDPLDENLLKNIKQFLNQHNIPLYTEHLSWCSHKGHLYELLPIPLTQEALQWIITRIQRVQDILERPIGLENASYYFSPPDSDLSETDFIGEMIKATHCFLHLDINNVYVNSQNHHFDPFQYIQALPLNQVQYIHVAGHHVEANGTIIDTHGNPVISPVWNLLKYAYSLLPATHVKLPTCLERDFNFPELPELLKEVAIIQQLQSTLTLK